MVKTMKKIRNGYNPHVSFTTVKIAKNSTIRIEIWDKSASFFDYDGIIQIAEGNVESFLNKPIRYGTVCPENKQNSIETMAFWRDEFSDM